MARRVLPDPLGLTSYPVSFLSSLFATDMPALVDGSITCPVVAFVSMGDPLFTRGYSRLVYERLVAPGKQLVELPADHHLILNERIENVTPDGAGRPGRPPQVARMLPAFGCRGSDRFPLVA